MRENQSKPYQNSRIISAIRDICFTGPFAQRYNSRFPTFQGADGKVVRQVPVAMVALVATAVSVILFSHYHVVLTQIVSSMPASRSGRLVGISLPTSQQTPF